MNVDMEGNANEVAYISPSVSECVFMMCIVALVCVFNQDHIHR